MKSFTAAVTAVAGAALFAKSAYAQLPPIVIKVGQLSRPLWHDEPNPNGNMLLGLQILL